MKISGRFVRFFLLGAGAALFVTALPNAVFSQVAGSRAGLDWFYLADNPITIWGTVLTVKYNDCPDPTPFFVTMTLMCTSNLIRNSLGLHETPGRATV